MAEPARGVLERGILVAQRGGAEEVHVRVRREREREQRAPVAADVRELLDAERLLGEASRPERAEEREGRDVARDHERERRCDAPGAPARQIGAGDEPRERDPDHDRRRRHAGDEQPGGDDELERPLPPQDLPGLAEPSARIAR